jgi:hypothetical protein
MSKCGRSISGMIVPGETEVLGDSNVPALFCLPQIPHGLPCDRTQYVPASRLPNNFNPLKSVQTHSLLNRKPMKLNQITFRCVNKLSVTTTVRKSLGRNNCWLPTSRSWVTILWPLRLLRDVLTSVALSASCCFGHLLCAASLVPI